MFKSINEEFNARKRNARENQRIIESVLGVDEIIPGSDDEIDDTIDTDSVPEDAYRKIDAALDKIVDDPNYDDSEAEELLEDDELDDDDPVSAAVNEAVEEFWCDDEGINHPLTSRRSCDSGTGCQPLYKAAGQDSL